MIVKEFGGGLVNDILRTLFSVYHSIVVMGVVSGISATGHKYIEKVLRYQSNKFLPSQKSVEHV